MKSATYFPDITDQKAENYLSEIGKLESTCLLTCLPCVNLRNFPHEFTKNCFAVFDQSSCAVYLTKVTFFPGTYYIIPFMA